MLHPPRAAWQTERGCAVTAHAHAPLSVQALQDSTSDEDVRTRANGLLNVLVFI